MLSIKVVRDLLSWIEHNLEEELDLDVISKKSGYGKTQLQKVFKRITGFNVMTYIRYRRICKTSTILKLTHMPIIDVATMYHFGTQQNYCRVFKGFFGVTPSEFRKRNIDFSQSVLPISLSLQPNDNLDIIFFDGRIVHGELMCFEESVYDILMSGDISARCLSEVKKKMYSYNKKNEYFYTVIDYGASINKKDFMTVTYLIGYSDDKSHQYSRGVSKRIPSGWYARKVYVGTWLSYNNYSTYIYTHLLPKFKLKRREGFDFEVFYIGDEKLEIDVGDFLLCEYYIPIMVNDDI